MDTATLRHAMGNRAITDAMTAACNEAMIAAGCTTINRAAMWCAQIGHESVGLLYFKELGGPSYFARYNNRRDLGNGPADGPRYPGRGPIQLTGRHNYGRFSVWCHARGLVPSPTYFVDRPELVEQPRWGFLAAAWYWTVARPRLNEFSDRGDLHAATRAINGGLNGLADRQRRWDLCRGLGARLLPTVEDDDMTPDQDRMLRDLHDRVCRVEKAWAGGVTDDKGTPYDLRLLANRQNVEQRQTWLAVQKLGEKLDQLAARLDNKP